MVDIGGRVWYNDGMIGEWELRLSYEAAYLAMQHHELVIEVRHIVAGVRDLFLVQWRRQANRLGLRIRLHG